MDACEELGAGVGGKQRENNRRKTRGMRTYRDTVSNEHVGFFPRNTLIHTLDSVVDKGEIGQCNALHPVAAVSLAYDGRAF